MQGKNLLDSFLYFNTPKLWTNEKAGYLDLSEGLQQPPPGEPRHPPGEVGRDVVRPVREVPDLAGAAPGEVSPDAPDHVGSGDETLALHRPLHHLPRLLLAQEPVDQPDVGRRVELLQQEGSQP